MNYMPFNFERLSNGKILISNQMGFFTTLNDERDLEILINGEVSSDCSMHKELLDGQFIYTSESQLKAQVQLYSSAYSYRVGLGVTRPYLFMVVPTLRCDHDCTYCQVSRVNEDEAGYDLDMKHIDGIVENIIKYGESPYKVEFQGGEPLLSLSFIERFIEKFEASIHEGAAEYVIATSLSKLNEKVIDLAKRYPIVFSTSLDAGKELHDKNRRHAFVSSFAKVKEGVERINSELGEGRVSTVTTVTRESVVNPTDIIDAHVELGLKDLFVRPLSPYGFASYKHESYYTAEQYIEFYKLLLSEVVDRYQEQKLVEHYTLIHLERIFKKDQNRYVDLKSPSGHVMGAMVFNYDGKVFGSDEARMMYEQHGIEELSLGHVSEGFSLLDNMGTQEILSSSFISESPGCDECAYQPYCGADSMHHLATQGDPVGDKSRSYFCKIQKGTFDTIFTMLENPDSRSVFMEWLDA